MRKTIIRAGVMLGVACLSVMSLSGVAAAQNEEKIYQANLRPTNTSKMSGTANVVINGKDVTVKINTTGGSPNLAHPQHVHIGGKYICADKSADTNKDGYVSTTEGEPSAGPVRVALTTRGDVSSASGLAIDRFPVAKANGSVTYERKFQLPSGVTAEQLGRGVVEIHGISELFNDKAKYDGDKKSDVRADLPFETTVPAACGKLTAAPAGGADTGIGSLAGIEHAPLLAVGALGIIAAGTILVARRIVE